MTAQRLRDLLRRRWPALRLRVILLSVLLFAAALPAFGALFLRVYENTLVRQTEAELIAQGAAIAAVTAFDWPHAIPKPVPETPVYRPEPLRIDLRSSPVLDERPPPTLPDEKPDPAAIAAARKVEPIVRETSKTTLASIRLTDSHGTVVMGQRDVGLSYAALPEVQDALQGKTSTLLRRNGAYRQRTMLEFLSRAAGIRVHHARPVKVDGKVVAVVLLARSPRGLFVGIYEDRGKLLLGLVLIVLVLVGIAALLSRGIARPIEALTQATADVARGPVAIPETPATAAVEIRTLYDDFRVMAARIERRSRYLRDFAAAVSHEFKTPIAGLKGAIELLDEHGGEMSDDERQRFLANMAGDADRLSHLVQRLLDLARADMAVGRDDVSTLLKPLLAGVVDAHEAPGLAFALEVEARLPPVAVPAEAIEAALETLIENSRHAGATHIRIAAHRIADRVRLSVGDDGHGIAPGDRDRLFEPFFTSRRTEGGTGLGLAIVRSLLAASGAEIELAEAQSGACFVLDLPLAMLG